MLKNKKGITLIALVITIIVLLILAGVTLSFVAGENGILKRATLAVNINGKEVAKEQVSLEIASYQTEYYEERYVNKTIETNQEMGDWIFETYGGENETDDYVFIIEKSKEKDIYKVTIKKNEKLETDIIGTLSSGGKLTWDEIPEEWNIEADLVDYWDLSSSLENKVSDSLTGSLRVYRGNDFKFEENSVHLESTFLSTQENYEFPERFTLLLEYKPTSINTWTMIVGKHINYWSNSDGIGIFIHDTLENVHLLNGSNNIGSFEVGKLLTIGSYTKIAITYDGEVCKLYGNGELIKEEQTFKDLNGVLYVGGGVYSGTDTANTPWGFANGYYRNLKIYDGALSQEDIRHVQ